MTTHPGLGRQVAVALYVLAMVAIIVGVDLAFLRDRFWMRLAFNLSVVVVFLALYVKFIKLP